jgi:hypothetical protein
MRLKLFALLSAVCALTQLGASDDQNLSQATQLIQQEETSCELAGCGGSRGRRRSSHEQNLACGEEKSGEGQTFACGDHENTGSTLAKCSGGKCPRELQAIA